MRAPNSPCWLKAAREESLLLSVRGAELGAPSSILICILHVNSILRRASSLGPWAQLRVWKIQTMCLP